MIEKIVGTLATALAALFERTAQGRQEGARALREALLARTAGPVRDMPSAPPAVRRAGAASDASPGVAAQTPAPERTSTAARRPTGKPKHELEPAEPAMESRLVRSLFAGPESLAAAFTAAEILAKPVALRKR